MEKAVEELSTLRIIFRLFSYWPIRFATFFLSLNVEFVLTPSLQLLFGLSGLELNSIICTLATVEIIFWNWFFGWLTKGALVEFKELKKRFYGRGEKKLFVEIKWVAAEIWLWVDDEVIRKFDPENEENKHRLEVAKEAGDFLRFFYMLFMGFTPGLWALGIVICRKLNWPKGLIPLVIGNAVKIACWGYLWQLYFSAPWYIQIFLPLFLTYKISRFILRLIKKHRR